MLFILLCTSFVCGLSIRGSGFSRNRRSRASHCPRSQLGRCQARADIIVFGTAQPFVTGRIMIEKSPENQPDETDGAGQDECPLPPPMNGDPGDQQRCHDRADHRARIIKSGGQCPFLLREPFGHRFISCREVARFADTQQSPGNCKACGSGSKTVQYGSHAPDG